MWSSFLAGAESQLCKGTYEIISHISLRYVKVPEDEQWKAGLLKELLLASGRVLTVENMKLTEIKIIIDHLCTG